MEGNTHKDLSLSLTFQKLALHSFQHMHQYRCTFGPGLMGRPEARKKKHGPGTVRPEII
jgi:hypothetical protein